MNPYITSVCIVPLIKDFKEALSEPECSHKLISPNCWVPVVLAVSQVDTNPLSLLSVVLLLQSIRSGLPQSVVQRNKSGCAEDKRVLPLCELLSAISQS